MLQAQLRHQSSRRSQGRERKPSVQLSRIGLGNRWRRDSAPGPIVRPVQGDEAVDDHRLRVRDPRASVDPDRQPGRRQRLDSAVLSRGRLSCRQSVRHRHASKPRAGNHRVLPDARPAAWPTRPSSTCRSGRRSNDRGYPPGEMTRSKSRADARRTSALVRVIRCLPGTDSAAGSDGRRLTSLNLSETSTSMPA